MKRFLKKTALIILLFVLLAINLLVIADSSQTLVNLGASLRFSAEKTEVLTGEAHKVTIKSAYADPNNEINAIYRVYLKNKDGSPNTNVQILNMEDNKITYEDLNALGDVEVVLKEDKDTDGEITKRYLEYVLRPGMTVFMEIEFYVPAGKIREEKLVLGGEIVYSNDNEKNEEETNAVPQGRALKMMSVPNLTKGINNIDNNEDESSVKDVVLVIEEVDDGSGNNELLENEGQEELATDEENDSGEVVEEQKQDEEIDNEEQKQDEEIDNEEQKQDEEIDNEEQKQDEEIDDEEQKQDEEQDDEEQKQDEEQDDEEQKQDEEIDDEEQKQDEEQDDEEQKQDEEIDDEEQKQDKEINEEEQNQNEEKDDEEQNKDDKQEQEVENIAEPTNSNEKNENVLAKIVNRIFGSIALAISNEKIDEDLELTWKGEFDYGGLSIRANSARLIGKNFTNDVTIYYNLDSNNNKVGCIFAKNMNATITLLTGDVMLFPENATYDGNGNIKSGDTILLNVTVQDIEDYDLDVEIPSRNKIIINIAKENKNIDEADIDNIIKALTINFYTSNFSLTAELVQALASQHFKNEIHGTVESIDGEIKYIEGNKIINIDNSPSGIVVKKNVRNASVSQVNGSGSIVYTIEIANNSSKDYEELFEDNISKPLILPQNYIEGLENEGYTVTSNDDGYKITKIISIPKKSKVTLEYLCAFPSETPEDEPLINTVSYFDSSDTYAFYIKGNNNYENISLSKDVTGRYPGYRYLSEAQKPLATKITSGNDLLILKDGDLIEYTITLKNSGDYDVFLPRMTDYLWKPGLSIGDHIYGLPNEEIFADLLVNKSTFVNDIYDNTAQYKNNTINSSLNAPVWYDGVHVPANSTLKQTVLFLVARDTSYASMTSSFAMLQYLLAERDTPDSNGYTNFVSDVEIGSLSASSTQKVMDLKFLRNNHFKLGMEIERRYPGFLYGNREVVHSGDAEINYVTLGDIIEYTIEIENTSDYLIDFENGFTNYYIGTIFVSGPNEYSSFYSWDSQDIEQYVEDGLLINSHNDLKDYFIPSAKTTASLQKVAIPAHTTYRQTIVEVVGTEKNNTPVSYAEFYSTMKSKLGSANVDSTTKEIYKQNFAWLQGSYGNIYRDVGVKSLEQLQDEINYDFEIIGRYPNYANSNSEKIVSGDMLKEFSAGDRLEVLITIDNNTPICSGSSTNNVYMINWLTSLEAFVESGEQYNDILKDSSKFKCYGANSVFEEFVTKPYTKYTQKVIIDIPTSYSYNNGTTYNLIGEHRYESGSFQSTIPLRYVSNQTVSLSSGVYTKLLKDNDSTNIEDYKNLNLNYYTEKDKNIIYYGSIINNANNMFNLWDYDIYINFSKNQKFDGLYIINDVTKIPEKIVGENITGNLQVLEESIDSLDLATLTYTVSQISETCIKINFTGNLISGEGLYFLYSLSKDNDADGILETTVSICKKDETKTSLIHREDYVAYQSFIENAEELYTEDNLDHEVTTNLANYEKTYGAWDELEYVTTPSNERLQMWSGVYLKQLKAYKVHKKIYESGDLYGSGEDGNSICFEIDASQVVDNSGDKNLVIYDILTINTNNFKDGKDITDYFDLEPLINNEEYLLIKDENNVYQHSSYPRVTMDDRMISGISVKYFSGDILNSEGYIDYELARNPDNWKDDFCFINDEENKINVVTMKFEFPETFKEKAILRYKLFLKDEAENISGKITGNNKAGAGITDESKLYEADTNNVYFEFENEKMYKNLKVTNVVLDYDDTPSEEFAEEEFVYKVYKIDSSQISSGQFGNYDSPLYKYQFEFTLKSTEEKNIPDAFAENNLSYVPGETYVVVQEEKKYFDTSATATYINGAGSNTYKYAFTWSYATGVKTIDYVNRYNTLYDGTKRDLLITKKLGTYCSGDLIKEDLASGDTIDFNLLDDDGNKVEFVDLETQDEHGAHYRVATQDDTVKTFLLRTYKGKIYIEGLYKYITYTLTELNTPEDYKPDAETLNIEISSGDGAYDHEVVNVFDYNNDVSITKVDISNNIITSGKAIFNIVKNNKTLYFKYLGINDDCNYYELVGEEPIDGAIQNIETYKGKIRLTKMKLGTYTVNEIEAPEGYIKSSTNGYLLVTSLSEPVKTNIRNSKLVDLQIVKQKSYATIGDDLLTDHIITEDETTFYMYENYKSLKFVKLGIEDESGEHYRLATSTDTNTSIYFDTYKGKVYLEGLNDSTEYTLYEYKAPDGYIKANFSKRLFVGDGKYIFYNNPNVNSKISIMKKDYHYKMIKTDKAVFELTNEGGDKLYFKRLENREEFSMYELLGTTPQDGSVSELETFEGKLVLVNVPIGAKLNVREIKAPEGYVKTDSISTITVTNTNLIELNIRNGSPISDVKINKTNTNGVTINTNSAVFEIYTSSGDVVRFKDLESADSTGRLYSYSPSGDERIITYNGKIHIKDLPIGKYKIKEIVAPDGYSILDEDVAFSLNSFSFANPPTAIVKDPSYVFGSEGYVSLSYQKIMERDNSDNYGYGFAVSNGTDNYISVLSKEDIVKYTLNVANNAKKSFNNIVLINKLANIDDTGTVNLDSRRGSQYRISLDRSANIELRLFDEQGRYTIINPSQYKIDYTDKLEYSEDDWNGEDSDLWYDEAQDSTQAFRITFAEDFELPSTYSIATLFDGIISEDAKPGEIAWNSFGYRYYVDGIDLTAEPPKVGVMIAKALTITKKVVYNEKDETATDIGAKEFEFYVYEKGNDTPIKTLTLKSGDTVEIDFKILSGKDGDLEFGKTYIIKEKEEEGYSIKEVKINHGEAYYDNVEFEADPKNAIEIVFTNEKDYVEEPEEPEKPEESGDPEKPEESGDPETPDKPDKPKTSSGGSKTKKISKDVEIVVTETPNDKKDDVVVEETTNEEEKTNNDIEEVIPPEDNNNYDVEPYIPDNPVVVTYTVITTQEELPKTGDNITQYVLLFIAMISLEIIIRKKK